MLKSVMTVTLGVASGLLFCTSMVGADCGTDHKAAGPAKPDGTVAKGDKSADKAPVVVVGAPGQSVDVKAGPTESVSAVGGAGTPGRAGAAGKPGQ